MLNLMAAITTVPIIIPILCLIVGIIFMIIEIFSPGFGIFGFLGIILVIAGIVIRTLSGGSPLEIILTSLAVIALITFVIVRAVKSAKTGRLSRSALILSQSSVPVEKTEGTKDFSALLGQVGVTKTFLRPIGKAEFDGEIYEVTAGSSEIIEAGETVKVTYVEGQTITVKKFI